MSWKPKSKIISLRKKREQHGRVKSTHENRFIRESANQLAVSRNTSWWFLIWPFAFAGAFYLFISADIKAFNCPNTRHVNRAEIVKLFEEQKKTPALAIFNQSNFILFDTENLKNELNERYQFHYLKVSKNLTNLTINLDFQEKDYNIIWQEGDNYYYINFAGDIIITQPTSTPETIDNLLAVLGEGAEKKRGRSIKVDEKYLRYALALDEALKNKTKGLSEWRIIIGTEHNTVKVKLNNGPVIFFNTETDISEQLNKLEVLRRNELADGKVFNSQQYIDIRYGNAIYFK